MPNLVIAMVLFSGFQTEIYLVKHVRKNNRPKIFVWQPKFYLQPMIRPEENWFRSFLGWRNTKSFVKLTVTAQKPAAIKPQKREWNGEQKNILGLVSCLSFGDFRFFFFLGSRSKGGGYAKNCHLFQPCSPLPFTKGGKLFMDKFLNIILAPHGTRIFQDWQKRQMKRRNKNEEMDS
jgi:hypothetical protein